MRSDPAGREASRIEAQTNRHYDAYPFDFLTPADEAAIEEAQPRPFQAFVERHARQGLKVAEIGCGPGRGTMFLLRQGLDVVAVDISFRSLELARARAPSAHFVRATNLALPLRNAGFDMVVSDGVIHHTPDARRSFRENVRILAPGGMLYVGVYNRRGHYFYLYTAVGGVARRLDKTRLGRVALYATLFPLYFLAHLVKSRGRRTLRGTLNLFYDYFITPQASFHRFDEIAAWGQDEGLDLVSYDARSGNVHAFAFEKRQSVPCT